MRVLIVGCGYVGLPLGRALAQSGHEVFGLRRSAAAQIALQTFGVQPLLGDITQPATLDHLPRDYDWVINCAASSGGGAEDYRRLYLAGTRNLLAWLQQPAKFAYTSSTSVYGQTDGSFVDEQSPTEPAAETAKILLQTEHLLVEAARNFPAVILRVAGIYGPGRGHWFKQFLRNEARLEGQGDRCMNMIHRDDVAGAIVASLHHGQPGRTYNVVDDEPVTQIDFFKWLASELGRPLPPSVPPDNNAPRARGRTNKRVSNRRLKAELGYQFLYPTFRQGYAAMQGLE